MLRKASSVLYFKLENEMHNSFVLNPSFIPILTPNVLTETRRR